MEHHYWGWLIVVYLFLGGLGAGAYLTSFASENGWLGNATSLNRAGYFIAGPLVAVGTGLLVLDLGQGLHKPWLLIGLLTNPSSVMTWGTYIISLFILIACIKGYFAWKKKEAPVVITYAGAILALATGTYTGLLIAVAQAIPFWNTMLMPAFFVISALSTGMSATSILAPYIEKGPIREGKAPQAHLLFVAVEIAVAIVFFGTMLSGTNGSVAAQSAQMIVSGSLSIVFWILFVALGLLFPAGVYTLNTLKLKRVPLQFGDAIPAVSVAEDGIEQYAATDEHSQHSILVVTSDAAALVGGFALRYLIIFAALPIWDGITLY